MYLLIDELKSTYYPKAAQMPAADVALFLQRANAFCAGEIGGALPVSAVDYNLKTAVALAFEIMARGESAQVDPVNGNITEAAPFGFFVKKPEPLDTVKAMLVPYAELYRQLQPDPKRGAKFL